MHRFVQIGVAFVALALITRTWLVEGLVDPLRVSGSSMAPALLGAHRLMTCPECGFAFACGEESLPPRMLAVCPNCGAQTDIESWPVQAGDRLIVDRAAFGLNGPQRWDVAVLQTPDDPLALCVKRVVGLPGETVEIRDGDIYADGQPARRSLRQVLAMAIPVHDASCRPTGGNPRWQSERAGSGWRQIETSFSCGDCAAVPGAAEADIDWLEYEHEQTVAGGRVTHRVGPILDDLAYNQNESRELLAVPDVILRCRVESSVAGELWLRADDGRKRFEVEIDVQTGDSQLWSSGQRLERFSVGNSALSQPVDIVLALVDAGLRLTLDGNFVLDYVYDPAGLDCRPVARPLAIGSKGSRLSLAGLKVLRDVYYLPPGNGSVEAPRLLGADEYWLLGDNCAVSVDSRVWRAARANLFIGKALIHRPPN